ncbi:MAG: Jag N-terminal domain-containing protein, partial [Clostridiales bacterium]|nr:Jag N-terminal domain-containing protein [Clostridiales bacterium]
MIKEAIVTAPTRDEAIEKAKAQLNAPIDADVKFEILQDAQKKVLGLFGGKDAKVRAYYEVADKEVKPIPEKKNSTVKKEPVKNSAAPTKTAVSEKVKSVSNDADISAVKGYLEAILNGMGVKDVTITSNEEGEETIFEIGTSESYGAIIGRHGETLDAIQYIVRLYANKHTDGRKKVSLNIGDYREKRAESLRAMATRSANQVLKYGRNAKLEPMNPYERRIIHTTVQGIEGVTSHSVGFDSERRVIITLEDGVQPTHGDRRRGGYNNNRGGNRGGYNNRGGNR